jgi:hypothetical protein
MSITFYLNDNKITELNQEANQKNQQRAEEAKGKRKTPLDF